MAADAERTDYQTSDQAGRERLEIYAREILDHFTAERRMRRDLEHKNEQLERRVREVTGLNRLFWKHLTERSAGCRYRA